jgi:hypothetical protein
VQQNLKYQGSGAVAAVEEVEEIAAYEISEDPAMGAADQADDEAWRTRHAINVRITIPLPFSRFYLTVVGGRERRNPDRRADERHKHPLVTKGNVVFLGILGIITGLAMLALIQFAARFALERAGVV